MNWKLRTSPEKAKVERLSKELKLSETLVQLCLQRQLDDQESIRSFLFGQEPVFYDPFLLYDMDRMVERLKKAIEYGERILVYGDYDADGITSTTILVETLEMLGAEVSYYLPDRFNDGYGPNKAVYKYYINEGIQVILTCDNGVAGHEAVEWAMEQGVDVLISDHHELPETLPAAFAIVHPRHPKGRYPFDDLSGAGVALKIAAALLEEIPTEMLDIAAIGTVADLVSLTDENRWIVKEGLKVLQQTQRAGLSELLRASGTDIKNADEETIGFVIGPRLNAIGRLNSASPGVELLMSFDEDTIRHLVQHINDTNNQRQTIVQSIYQEAKERVTSLEALPDVIVLAREGWHEGVLGIAASRLVEDFGRPVVLLTKNSETGIAKGSARSIEAFHIYRALAHCSNELKAFGGHKMAAGLSLEISAVDGFIAHLTNYARDFHEEIIRGQVIYVDRILTIEETTVAMLQELELLKPYGTGNPKPVFAFQDLVSQNIKRIGTDQSHLKFTLKENEMDLDVIGFNKGFVHDFINERDTVTVIGELSINRWKEFVKPQLQLKDIKSDQKQFFDKRGKQYENEIYAIEQADYLFMDPKLYDYYQDKLPKSSRALLLEEKMEVDAANPNLVILECPDSLKRFVSFYLDHPYSNYYFACYTRNSVYLEGLPDRKMFQSLYTFLLTHPALDLKNRLDALAAYLGIKKTHIIFMIKVFLEVKFVKIENGLLETIKNPAKVNLETTAAYQKQAERLQAEEMFVYSSFPELVEWLNEQNN